MRLLRTTDEAEIEQIVSDLSREQQQITHGIHSLLISMKGALTREEAWCLSHDERRDIMKILEERAKAAAKSGVPHL